MRLEHSLVLNRYLLHLLGADGFEELQGALYPVAEGGRGDGQSRFLGVLDGRKGLQVEPDALARYDRRVLAYEERLRQSRPGFRFRYFQYLALLFTELVLDRATNAPDALLRELNAFLAEHRNQEAHLRDFAPFEAADLRRLAYFMATGSGKTLLMHVNLWQVRHYRRAGDEPGVLFGEPEGRPNFDHVLLITPSDTLSQQHLADFAQSGIPAVHLSEALRDERRYRDHVKVVEIQKLVFEDDYRGRGDGLSVPVEALGARNLVLVDEGHKGTGSDTEGWKAKQKALSSAGMLIEYSATFAQAVAAAPRAKRDALAHEFGRAVVFDYSYRYFYSDGYGKDFNVLNVRGESEGLVDELLLHGLLLYVQQLRTYLRHPEEARGYNLPEPLFVFVGSKVIKSGKQDLSDVATVLAFVRRFLAEPEWATAAIGRALLGEDDLLGDQKTELFDGLVTSDPATLYAEIARDVFRGEGALEVYEIKHDQADGEFGLRVSAPADPERPYFGVVNIGDSSAFKRHIRDDLDLEIEEDAYTDPLFPTIKEPDSTIRVLVGAKKFIEGWSSWRVATMGLLNIGRKEGSQVIQLFGRGVRLLGKNQSLKRSTFLPGDEHPGWIGGLETLNVFGWRADYVSTFRKTLEDEGITSGVDVPTRFIEPLPTLSLPRPPVGFDATDETWILDADEPGLDVRLDRTPKVTLASGAVGGDGAGRSASLSVVEGGAAVVSVRFEKPSGAPTNDAQRRWAVLDWNRLHRDVLAFKSSAGYGNLLVPRDALEKALHVRCTAVLPRSETQGPEQLQRLALDLMRTFVERYYRRRERQTEGRVLHPVLLDPATSPGRDLLIQSYRVQSDDNEVIDKIRSLVAEHEDDEAALWTSDGDPLPRLHFDRHLYAPLLQEHEGLTIKPAPLNEGEARVINDLRSFWKENHSRADCQHLRVHVLRNLPHVGVGFYRRSGFYPDFVVWVEDTETGWTRIVFVEPHGIRHEVGGIHSDKLQALLDLRAKSTDQSFQSARIALDGYVLSTTPRQEIAGADGLSEGELTRDHALILLDENPNTDDRDRWVSQVLAL